MARANLTWGEERIADELLLKLGIAVSPRTVRCYLSRAPPRHGVVATPILGGLHYEYRLAQEAA